MEKERVIEDKNKEILRLRIQIEDFMTNSSNALANGGEMEVARKSIIKDLGIVYARMKSELMKAK